MAFEQDVRESPTLCRQSRRITHFAFDGHKGVLNSAARRVAGRPGFARTRVGSVPVSAQGAAINPSVGNCVENLLAIAAE